MPLHPQAAAVLAQSKADWADMDIPKTPIIKVRERAHELWAGWAEQALPPEVAFEELQLSGPAMPLRARVYRPKATSPVGAILWIHGGGFIVGSLEIERIPAALALASDCAVVSIEYRLAPEHPFPAPLDDCYAALRWVADHVAELGDDGSCVGLGGISAGGNLAAAVALMARDLGGPEIALQTLLVPMITRQLDAPSRRDPAVGGQASADDIEWLWQQYIGDADGSDPLACPLEAESLAGLPPALVITAEYDVLRDEGEAYVERLEREGVPVELRRYDGMHHSFPEYPGVIDAADECIEQMGAAFRRALTTGAMA
jgi:acetyl esterase